MHFSKLKRNLIVCTRPNIQLGISDARQPELENVAYFAVTPKYEFIRNNKAVLVDSER